MDLISKSILTYTYQFHKLPFQHITEGVADQSFMADGATDYCLAIDGSGKGILPPYKTP